MRYYWISLKEHSFLKFAASNIIVRERLAIKLQHGWSREIAFWILPQKQKYNHRGKSNYLEQTFKWMIIFPFIIRVVPPYLEPMIISALVSTPSDQKSIFRKSIKVLKFYLQTKVPLSNISNNGDANYFSMDLIKAPFLS